MTNCMMFPDTVEEYMEQYKIVDTEQVYTNGAELVSIFRMKQWFEHLPSAQPERKKMSNKEWVNFLSEQFTVSRTSAREMLHRLMKVKSEDNFKKQYSGSKNEKGKQ